MSRSVSLFLSLLVVFSVGCSRPLPSDMPNRSTTPLDKKGSDAKLRPDRFSRTLAITSLNFGIDDCRSNLYTFNGVMNDLNAATQRDHWESSKKRYASLKATYHQLCQQWADMAMDHVITDETRLSVKTRLDELGQMFEAADDKIWTCDKDYTQARQSYESKKRQFFEAFQNDLRERHAAKGRFYTNTSINLGVSAVDRLPHHVLVTIEAYAKAPVTRSGATQEEVSASQQVGLSSIQGLEKAIRLIDLRGVDFGPPEDVAYDRLCTVNGLIVTLAYERHPNSGRIPDKLCIDPLPFENSVPITLSIPLTTRNRRVFNPLDTAGLFGMDLSGDSDPVNGQMNMIQCQRAGMHLKVPVTLDIHGVKIKTHMILDTGASVTVLAKSVYSRGIAKPLDSLPQIRMKTANGMITCPVDTLQISTSTYTKKIPVALTSDSTSLLGANYFAGRRITMDLKNECIYIHP